MPSLITPLACGNNILGCVITTILSGFKVFSGALKPFSLRKTDIVSLSK